VTDASTACNIRIGSNDKLHRAQSLTKTSFLWTLVRAPLHTVACLILLHYSAELFGVYPAELYFHCGLRAARKRPPRKQPGDDRRLVILPRRWLSTKFYRLGCFLFIAVGREEKEKERNRRKREREREIYERAGGTKESSRKSRGKRVEWGKISKERADVREEEDDLVAMADRSTPLSPGVVSRVNRCSTTQRGVLLRPAWKSLECSGDPDRPGLARSAVAHWTLYL